MKRSLIVVALAAATMLVAPVAGSAATVEAGQTTQIEAVKKLAEQGDLDAQVEELSPYVDGKPGS